MKDSRPPPLSHQQPAHLLPTLLTGMPTPAAQADSPHDPQCQRPYVIEETSLTMRPPPFAPMPLGYEQTRISRERADRTSVEDKIRRAVDNWTAEERATAYWYLYACGMTLERAKAIRHKGGFHA